MTAPEQWAWLARIRRTQGRKGEVFAEILTDFPEKFSERKRLWLIPDGIPRPGSAPALRTGGAVVSAPREAELVSHWLHKGDVVLHFAGVDSISAAETLIGLGVAIPRTERVALGEDEAYISDLIGCTLIEVAGSGPVEIGSIEDVDTTAGPAPLLVVRAASNPLNPGEPILIPFAKAYLRRLDMEGRRVEMALPEGLLDLNGP